MNPSSLADIWRTFVAQVRADPDLRNLLGGADKVWAWDGGRWDEEEPTLAQMPCVRLTPTFPQSGWHSNDGGQPSHLHPITVRVETWSKGKKFEDSARLWEVLLAAFYPPMSGSRREPMDAAILAAGCSGREVTKPACFDEVTGEAAKGIGMIVLKVYMET